MIAIDPDRCHRHGGGGLAHAETLFAAILEQDGTRLPSQRRFEARSQTASEGITIVQSLYDTLVNLQR